MVIMAFLFISVLLIGVPVFIALAGSSFIYTHFIAGLPDFVILHRMAGGIDSFPLLAVPFFILAGNLMNSAGDRKSTRLNSSHPSISYAVFCLKKKKEIVNPRSSRQTISP